MKTEIDYNWKIKNGVSNISEEDRVTVKQNILQALINCIDIKKIK